MNKYETVMLETDRLILKKGTSKDCIKVYEYDLLKCRGIGGEDVIVKSDKEIDFIGDNPNAYYKECIEDKRYDWFIYLKDGSPIGNITADRVDENNNSIELSYNLHPNYWKKGYMTEAVTCVMDYLFSIGFDNIIIGYDTGNYRSKNIADKLGFDYFITNKNVYMKNDYSIDSIKMIMSKEKWNDINKANHSRK